MLPVLKAMVQPYGDSSREESESDSRNDLQSNFQQELQKQLGERNYNHWFLGKTTVCHSAEMLTVSIKSPFLLTWMQKQFRANILDAAQKIYGPKTQVQFAVDADLSDLETKSNSAERKTSAADSADGQQVEKPADAKPVERQTRKYDGSRRYASLTDFVSGPSNELAITAVKQMCEYPGTRFNPLYLHGGVGLGKTHLLEGIYQQIRRQFPALKVLMLTAESFTNSFTSALREHSLPAFRQRFRNVDLLLVDDVQFLAGKKVIQEEFLHTFKHLESHQRQLVIIGDRHPRLFSKLSDELTTRFLSGLVCRIEAPDFKTRFAIVKHKAHQCGLEMTPKATEYVAQRFSQNVRELEGAINCLQTYHYMTGKRIGVTAARNVLSDLERDCIRIVRIPEIEQAVCDLFGLQTDDLKSSRRTRSLSQPRMLAMFLARKHTQAAFGEIGHYFGGRNHSTVVSADKKIKSGLDSEETIRVAAKTWPLGEVISTLEHQLQVG